MALPQCPELQGRRILIVEDELLVAMDVEDLLEMQGCVVLGAASTIEEALILIKSDKPEAVILDRNLDGDRTTPVAEELNRVGIPFVVMTGYVSGIADEPAMRHALCVQKPWIPAELLKRLNEIFA
ncbi:response regulator [Sphingomonas sp.]|uniref:response regulator n=1 Tax=Sphingomonas sp. TaxID=28214 RepID=UPI003D6C9E72